jgi:amino acid transporter
LVIVLYIAIAIVVVGSLTPQEIVGSSDVALAKAAEASLGGVGYTLVAFAALLATLSATNATLYGAARLSFTLATEGELSPAFRHKEWKQPVGLHVTALVGLVLAVSLPLSSISTVCSAIFLTVFAVVNAAAVTVAAKIGANRVISGIGALGCVGSLGVLLVRSWRQDLVGLGVLAGLVVTALVVERSVLRARREPGAAWGEAS